MKISWRYSVKRGTPSMMELGRILHAAQHTRGHGPFDNRGQSCQGSDEDSGALASVDLELFGRGNAPNVGFSGHAGDEEDTYGHLDDGNQRRL